MKIICVGRNYAAHAAELNNAIPEDPVIFLKPDSALLRNNDDFYIPEFSKDVHYECEVVFRINKLGKYIQPEFALSYIDGVGLGIDFTARDLQTKLKSKGLPWELSKAFNGSAVISEFLSPEEFPDLNALLFHLDVNGVPKQQGDTRLMLFPITKILCFVSQYFVLKTGDLIFTGTPAGVGPVAIGDRLEGYLENQKMFDFKVK
jgi:2-keto-4-pentenoate hydratase/2-oxohepta-3-ene-1,7-dioic acid hydratase in catechol pathway